MSSEGLRLDHKDSHRIRAMLDRLVIEGPEAFKTILRIGDTYTCVGGNSLLDDLCQAGMLEYDGLSAYRALYASFQLGGYWFITDLPNRPEPDSVFPLYPESRYFVKHMTVPEGAKALDLCTGCGLYPTFASRYAKSVVAVDINPRALEFAAFNLAMNELEERVELVQGDLFEPVQGQRFDYISVNPPFEPVPPGVDYYWHSAGGYDGLDTVRRLLGTLREHLSDHGRFEMVTFSLGNGSNLLLEQDLSSLTDGALILHVIAGPSRLHNFAQRFPELSMRNWCDDLERAGWFDLYLCWLQYDATDSCRSTVIRRQVDHSTIGMGAETWLYPET